MQILHLFANYKWTGPADPAIRCAVNLRRQGADLRFTQAGWTLPAAEHRMAQELWQARMPVIGDLELRKHFQPLSLGRDARRLRRRIAKGEIDLLHCHLLADHLLAAWARRRCASPPVLVRSLYDPQGPKAGLRDRLALSQSDGIVVPGENCAALVQQRFTFPKQRILIQEPPTDPDRLSLRGDLRAELGLREEHFVIGITARIQPQRCFDLLWKSARLVLQRHPRVRFVLLGRGNEEDTARLVTQPIKALGLEQQVILPGYLYEPKYSLALRALDLFVFLVPGSDGTCRAVREAMVLGLPVVATHRGILPDLIAGPGRPPGGLLSEEQPEAFAASIQRIIENPELRQRLGAAAGERARIEMNPQTASLELLAFYRQLAKMPRRGIRGG